MRVFKPHRNLWLSIAISSSVNIGPAIADEPTAQSPPTVTPQSESSKTSDPTNPAALSPQTSPTGAATPQAAATQQGTGLESKSSSAASHETSSSPSQSASQAEAGPGPLLEERKALLSKIVAAKKAGIGIAAYLTEYNRIEEMVKTGESPTNFQSRIESLNSGLEQQLKRGELLKTQRPQTGYSNPTGFQTGFPTGSTTGSPGIGRLPPGVTPLYGQGHLGQRGSTSNGNSDALVNEIRQKMGGKLNPRELDKISPELREKLMQNDQVKELMRQFGMP